MNTRNLLLLGLMIGLLACNKAPKDQEKQSVAEAKKTKAEAPVLNADTLQTPCAIFYFPTDAYTSRQIEEAKKKGTSDEAISEGGSDEGFYRGNALDILRGHNVPVVMVPENGKRAFNLKQADGSIVALSLDEEGGIMLCNGKSTPKKLNSLPTPEEEYRQVFGIQVKNLEKANPEQYKTYKGSKFKFKYPAAWLSDAKKMEYCPACYTSLEEYVAFHTAKLSVGVSACKDDETLKPEIGNLKEEVKTHLRTFGDKTSVLLASDSDNSYEFWYLLSEPESKEQKVYGSRTIKMNDGWYSCTVSYPANQSTKYFLTAQAILETFGSK